MNPFYEISYRLADKITGIYATGEYKDEVATQIVELADKIVEEIQRRQIAGIK